MISQLQKDSIESCIGHIVSIKRLQGGKNCLAYKLNTKKSPFFLKLYSANNDKAEEKLTREFVYASFLWNNGIRNIPKPIYLDVYNRIAIYGFLKGRKVTLLDKSHIHEVAKFIGTLSRLDVSEYRKKFVVTSEANAVDAAFCLNDIVCDIEKRILKFENMLISSKIDEDCIRHVFEIKKVFNRFVIDGQIDNNIDFNNSLLSPSDMGFHNILTYENRLYFFDFEYAGIDSLFKLLSDFFCQPQVPINIKYFSLLINMLNVDGVKSTQVLSACIYLCSLKWCLIILNCFFVEEKSDAGEISQILFRNKSLGLRNSNNYFNNTADRCLQLNSLIGV